MPGRSPRIPLRMFWDNFKWMPPVMILCIVAGNYTEKLDDARLSKFRDKSALYGGTVKPGDPPSW